MDTRYRTVHVGCSRQDGYISRYSVEVRLEEDGSCWRHDLSLFKQRADQLMGFVREAGVANLTPAEMAVNGHWARQDDEVWVESVHTGRPGAGTYNYQVVGPTRESIEQWREELYRRWHPCGYGTIVREIRELPDGLWTATAWRAGSCD